MWEAARRSRQAGRAGRAGPARADPARSLDLLLGADGQELLGALAGQERVDPGKELALGERLRARYPPELIAAALALHDLRLRALAKFSRAGRMYLTRDGLEQASSELVARHRAARYAGFDRVADLCTGIGGDLLALAAGRAALAVDVDAVHLPMALRNAREYGAENIAGACADVRDLRLGGLPAVFVDPARRAAGRRLPPGASEPSLGWCLALAERVGAVGVKAAPGLPLELVPAGWEVELIADRRELKEAVLWSPGLATAPRRATVLADPSGPPGSGPGHPGHPGGGDGDEPSRVTHTLAGNGPAGRGRHGGGQEAGQGRGSGGSRAGGGPRGGGPRGGGQDGDPVPCEVPGAYLLDPNPAVTRAGLVEELAHELGAWKIDRRVAFLSADGPLKTPFGRLLVVEESMPWGLKRLRAALRARGIGAVQIRKRGSAVEVEGLRRRLDLRGDGQATVVLTRVLDRPWALICREP
jgi:THUMP domain-like